LANSPGTPPTSDPRNGHPFFNNILEDEARAQTLLYYSNHMID